MRYLLTIAMMGLVFTIAPSCKKKSKSSPAPAPIVEEPIVEPVTPQTTDVTTTTAISGFNCTVGTINIGGKYDMIVDTTQNKVQLTKDGQSLVYTMVASTQTVIYAPQSTRYDLTLIDANGTAVSGDAGYLALEPDTLNYITKEDRGYRHAWLKGVPFDSKTIQFSQFSCK